MLAPSFRRNFLQHALAVSAWMQRTQAEGGIDPRTLGMELALGGRAFRFHPQFTVEQEGQLSFVPRLQPGIVGFVGWIPFPGKRWPAAADKRTFKHFAQARGLRTPA